MASSVRSPGTCQLNGAADSWFSTDTGISTDTPSRGLPGSKTYSTASVCSAPSLPATVQVSGNPWASSASADAVVRSSRVSVSRSGVTCRAFFHHASKCATEVTSAGTRAS